NGHTGDLKVFGNEGFLGVCEFEIETSILTSSLLFCHLLCGSSDNKS
ncbi:20666_t:CDS:1, partial [Gigaspora rosea]